MIRANCVHTSPVEHDSAPYPFSIGNILVEHTATARTERLTPVVSSPTKLRRSAATSAVAVSVKRAEKKRAPLHLSGGCGAGSAAVVIRCFHGYPRNHHIGIEQAAIFVRCWHPQRECRAFGGRNSRYSWSARCTWPAIEHHGRPDPLRPASTPLSRHSGPGPWLPNHTRSPRPEPAEPMIM